MLLFFAAIFICNLLHNLVQQFVPQKAIKIQIPWYCFEVRFVEANNDKKEDLPSLLTTAVVVWCLQLDNTLCSFQRFFKNDLPLDS